MFHDLLLDLAVAYINLLQKEVLPNFANIMLMHEYCLYHREKFVKLVHTDKALVLAKAIYDEVKELNELGYAICECDYCVHNYNNDIEQKIKLRFVSLLDTVFEYLETIHYDQLEHFEMPVGFYEDYGSIFNELSQDLIDLQQAERLILPWKEALPKRMLENSLLYVRYGYIKRLVSIHQC